MINQLTNYIIDHLREDSDKLLKRIDIIHFEQFNSIFIHTFNIYIYIYRNYEVSVRWEVKNWASIFGTGEPIVHWASTANSLQRSLLFIWCLSYELHYFPLPSRCIFLDLFYQPFSPNSPILFSFPPFASVFSSTLKCIVMMGWMTPGKMWSINNPWDTLWPLTIFTHTQPTEALAREDIIFPWHY